MKIDLAKIPQDGLVLDEDINFPEEYFQSGYVPGVKNAHIKGKVFYDVTEEVKLTGVFTGILLLEDAITLEPLEKPFSIELDEILKEMDEYGQEYFEKDKNILDIMGILWENIVLEVPIRIVKDENDTPTLKGEGWELMDDEEKRLDPRLASLYELSSNGKE